MRHVVVLAIVLLAIGCGGGSNKPNVPATQTRTAELAMLAAAQSVGTATSVPIATTVAATSTATVAVTATPKSTNTPQPTATSKPTATPRPTPTNQPTATPTVVPTPTLTVDEDKATYRADFDVRELAKNVEPYKYWKLVFTGRVLTIQATDKATFMQIVVPIPDGSDTQIIVVLFDHDPHAGDGIFEDDTVTVWVQPLTTFTFTNALGGQVTQPQCIGNYVEKQ